jgi:bacillithiol system protein YtxJ
MTWLAWLRGAWAGPGPEIANMMEMQAEADFDAALAASTTGPVWIFKHSTTCPISSRAHHQAADYAAQAGALPIYLVKVIESRPVSNAIAARLGVTHQSPQAILLRNGQAVWDASHGAITADSLRRASEG